jgi:hypothetical protein
MTALPAYETVTAEMVSAHVLKVTLNRPRVGISVNTQLKATSLKYLER